MEKDAAEIQQHLFLKILFYVLHAEAESAHLILTKAYNLYNLSKAIAEPRQTVGKYAPKIEMMTIDPATIGDVVGKQGKVINRIIAETGVKIDITDDGNVSICGTDADMIAKAMKTIEIITSDFEEGQVLEGTVISIKDFGAFLEFAPGKEGMVHISKMSDKRVEKVEDVLYALSDNCRTQMTNMKRLCYIWSAVVNYNLLWC